MLQGFHAQSQKKIVTLTERFLESSFFLNFPKWKDRISVLIEGSVANGRYDEFSDIDLAIIVPKQLQNTYTLEEIKTYKKHLRELKEPVQLHVPESYDGLLLKLEDWTQDGGLRELSRALIVTDPDKKMKELKKRFRWYPRPIFREKLNWLFAEAAFEYKERFEVAQKRHDPLFGECVKLNILRYLLNACLLATKNYPSFDKHLYKDVQSIKELPKKILTTTNLLIQTHDLKQVSELLKQLFQEVESYLIKKELLTKHELQYWIDLRPKYKVHFD